MLKVGPPTSDSPRPPDDVVAILSDSHREDIRVGPRLQNLASRVTREFPSETHAILLNGIGRLSDYQDERYASEYLDRLETIRDVDRSHDADRSILLREAARYLALWMTYEDAIRVADLKTRRTRFERVARETQANSAQVVQIHEFLYPRVEELIVSFQGKQPRHFADDRRVGRDTDAALGLFGRQPLPH